MRLLLIPLVLLLLAVPVSAADFPKAVGFVNDFAHVLTYPELIEEALIEYKQNTTIEIAVVTISSLPEDQTLATYAVELFQQWGIGKKGEDNGILVIMVPNGTVGNRLRIELGYGIQGYITGAESGRILDKALPAYESGDYQLAVEQILAGLDEQLQDYVPGTQPAATEDWNWIIVVAVFMVLFVGFMIAVAYYSGRCPSCHSRSVECSGNMCRCRKCGRTFQRATATPMYVGGGGRGGGGGGFGGGGSGGGGAGR